MHKIITKINIQDNLIICATFADGEVVSFNVEELFEKYPVFRILKDKTIFDTIKLDGMGYGVYWNDDLDLSSDGIYNRGLHIGKVESDNKLILAQSLAEIREEKGLSQRQLSKKSGIMQAEISKIEQAKGNPTISTLEKLAKTLGCSISSFFV